MILFLMFLFLLPILISFIFSSRSFTSSVLLFLVLLFFLCWHLVQKTSIWLSHRPGMQSVIINFTINISPSNMKLSSTGILQVEVD